MAKKSKAGREIVTLKCSSCGERNYTTMKNRRTTTEKLELNKYCPKERSHTLHKEIK
jgi:large subunit ribosomal protein L33